MSATSNLNALEKETGSPLQFTETRQSAVTTSWGVDWDEIYIARDIMESGKNRGQGLAFKQMHVPDTK